MPGRCRRLHFLHATAGGCADGTKVATYVLHSASGDTRELPVVYGQHVRAGMGRDGVGPIASDGTWLDLGFTPVGDPVQLYHAVWENPWPDAELRSLDFVSALAGPWPFLVAITVE